ncbi:phosphoribosylformylglycinamidine cyclo-ligase [Halorubellus sp. JP-L1]|uniref:phosphoribosylformylglycinamidine cyclo-ligase n=1 Tax=Halorubellus sp. JP-L1 TaxID=2715753 RepID=UPI001409A163|nr:phosphoribosylformylglycinamidine cyclo-ligase [Halorubellus sp. JP-L1]NHN40835.1 phosphoribosylformylglycinamidine cyclo-ligase [Halorubellus sp. JP-L1]
MTEDATEPGESEEKSTGDGEGMTYADAGVDVEASEQATAALLDAVGNVVETEYAGLLDVGDQFLSLATDGVGTKLLVAEAMADYSTVGIDCMAMNVNDLVAAGVTPVAFVDYLAVDEPDEGFAEQVGEGLRVAAERAGVSLLGGETAVMPEVVSGLDLAGTAAGLAEKEEVFDGEAEVGDALVAWPSSGIHSNGLTLARKAITAEYEYDDPFPADPDKTVGEVLLEPTRIYSDLLEPMREHDVRAAAHVTGGGWRNLSRMGDHRYEIADPFPAQDVFAVIQELGDVAPREMYETFNMGTGFVAAVPAEEADALADATEDGRVIGEVEEGDCVAVRGMEL